MLEKIGLGRPELRAWAMYDWALSGVQTVVMTAVFPIFFVKVAASHLAGSAATRSPNARMLKFRSRTSGT